MFKTTAVNSRTGDQVTENVWGTTLSDSAIASTLLLRAEKLPDSVDDSDRKLYKYNRQGERTEFQDQNGSVHAYNYDKLGRQTHDRVTTLASGVDGAVRRISRAYEIRGMVEKLTSYDNATVGSGSIVNEVQFVYNSFAQLTHDYQSHSGAVNTSTTPVVRYTFADGSTNHVRPLTLIYPNGRVLTYGYGTASGMDDSASRVASLIDNDGTTHLADYTYLGDGFFVVVDYTEPDVKWTMIGTAGGDDPDTGDIYRGLDRFSRIKDNLWHNYATATDVDRLKYGRDRVGNPLWRENTVAAALGKPFDELYSHDGLHRLKDMQRGTLNAGKTAVTNGAFSQCWTLDPVGNWRGFREDSDGTSSWDLVQSRGANKVNEITAITNTVGPAWAQPAFDRNGNMTTIPQPAAPTSSYTGTYDAWNRLRKLAAGASTVSEHAYDGAIRRVLQLTYTGGVLSETRHLYYTQPSQWQVVEERVGTAATADRQFVWGLQYVDDIVLRDRTVERRYGLQDANWNITALVNAASTVQERYAYAAYGFPTFLDATYGRVAGSVLEWDVLFSAYLWDSSSAAYFVRHRLLGAVLGTWLTRDPIAPIGDSVNSYCYADANPVTANDPTGLITVTSGRKHLGNVGCGNQASIRWDFTLDIIVNPKKPNSRIGAPCDGYIVQKVDVVCDIFACDRSSGTFQTFSYWEAWPVKKGKSRTHQRLRGRAGTDEAIYSAWPDTCGEYQQYGEIRFYCDNDGTLLSGWSPGSATNPVSYGKGKCSTTPGELVSKGEPEPGFWSRAPDDGPATRLFAGTWVCCPGNEHVDWMASPS